ncbi:ribosome maturation factor RimM [Corynebacterium sp.]|uniref:ribosome maturation factor RimM n=1 Tax=Corynebacterium sp. TaxID=1720 RepID=UPI0026E080E4|nr:ribosome maturation factor RimM [Corynebacterium sp.]MDO5511482.1 ribosome maturation factor RimM [Corynebacterium sp.]
MKAVNDNEVQIGRVIKPHGVRGELVVDPTTDDPDGRFAVGTVLSGRQTGKTLELTVKSVRPHQGRLLVTFEEIPGRTEAESLRGLRFFAEPVIDEEDDSYYDHELIGLRVLNVGAVSEEEATARAYEGAQPEPEDIGEITGVVRGTAYRLLEVRLDDGGGEAMVPFVHAIVPIVDLDNEAVVITPPEGLLDL